MQEKPEHCSSVKMMWCGAIFFCFHSRTLGTTLYVKSDNYKNILHTAHK